MAAPAAAAVVAPAAAAVAINHVGQALTVVDRTGQQEPNIRVYFVNSSAERLRTKKASQDRKLVVSNDLSDAYRATLRSVTPLAQAALDPGVNAPSEADLQAGVDALPLNIQDKAKLRRSLVALRRTARRYNDTRAAGQSHDQAFDGLIKFYVDAV